MYSLHELNKLINLLRADPERSRLGKRGMSGIDKKVYEVVELTLQILYFSLFWTLWSLPSRRIKWVLEGETVGWSC